MDFPTKRVEWGTPLGPGGFHMCFVAMLAREERRHNEIYINSKVGGGEYDEAYKKMEACYLLASERTPESEEGWAFLAYAYTRIDPKAVSTLDRISETLVDRHQSWA
jgi:hypothetical protein